MNYLFIDRLKAIAMDLAVYISNMPSKSRFARFIAGNVSREEYALWLGNTLRYVPKTVQVHALAAKALSSDPSRHHLAQRHKEAAAEESGHDILLVNDLKALGYNVTLLSVDTTFDTSPYIKSFADIELPMIGARNGIGAYGIATVMESLSAELSPKASKNLETANIPNVNKALSFLRAHAAADAQPGGHDAKNHQALAAITDPADQEFVARVATVTASLYKLFADDFGTLELS
jgi:Iron-containing redox enzyme